MQAAPAGSSLHQSEAEDHGCKGIEKMEALEAKLPDGPAQKVCYDDGDLEAMGNDERRLLFLSRMEAEVAGLMGRRARKWRR